MVPVEWGVAENIPENVGATLEPGDRQRLKQFGEPRRKENPGKFGTSWRLVERFLPKSLIEIWIIRSRLRWSQMKMRNL